MQSLFNKRWNALIKEHKFWLLVLSTVWIWTVLLSTFSLFTFKLKCLPWLFVFVLKNVCWNVHCVSLSECNYVLQVRITCFIIEYKNQCNGNLISFHLSSYLFMFNCCLIICLFVNSLGVARFDFRFSAFSLCCVLLSISGCRNKSV